MDVELETRPELHRNLNPRRPLLGLTILLIEDSRYCSEAVRLMCLKSGARLRRADSLRAARRHLATYRPSVVMVDLGLPDGPGTDIIADLAALKPPAPVTVAISGDDNDDLRAAALAAGAQTFMPKPFTSLKAFQTDVLALFPDRQLGAPNNVVSLTPVISPDPLAKAEDLRHALGLLQDIGPLDGDVVTYCAQFLVSVAEADGDAALAAAASQLAGPGAQSVRLAAITAMLERHLVNGPAI